MTSEPWAYFGGMLATGLTAVVDLATGAEALDDGGWWAVQADFEGGARAYRFSDVRTAPLPRSARWIGPDRRDWRSSLDEQAYRVRIERIKRFIEAGDVYQVNVCRLLSAPLGVGTEPAALAKVLTVGNPAPHAGVLHTGVDWIVCASPELFLSRHGSWLESAPIKGTSARPGGFVPKDFAENIMITDLVRNDLNRICLPSSVHVSSLLEAQQHPGLFHLVSTVRGSLRPGIGWRSILEATFPPGSVSGAPKIRALDVISELEPVPRGPYCGAIGFVDADRKTAQLAVAIRTFFTTTEEAEQRLHFGTGAGITYGSDPHGEWAETELKARRLVGLASGSPAEPRESAALALAESAATTVAISHL